MALLMEENLLYGDIIGHILETWCFLDLSAL